MLIMDKLLLLTFGSLLVLHVGLAVAQKDAPIDEPTSSIQCSLDGFDLDALERYVNVAYLVPRPRRKVLPAA